MHPFDLESAVNRQRWGWLVDLPQRLKVVIEVVDDRQAPLFPVGSSPAAASIRRMLTSGGSPLHSAIAEVMHSTTARSVAIDGFEAACFGLVPAGVLVLARELGGADSAAVTRDLQLIGSWLTGALEATLAAPPNAISAEPYRIASLSRILSDATKRGSVRNVVGAFVEALGVWDHVHVHSYVADARGGFLQFVSPMGIPSASLPAELGGTDLPADAAMIRLPRSDGDRLGLASEPGDVFVLRILTGSDAPWILLFSGAIDSREQVRLLLYSEMLREALNEVISAATNRLVAAVTRQRSLNGQIQAATQAALGELTHAVAGQEAALVATTATGRQVLTVGNTDLVPALEHQLPADRLVVAASGGGTLMVVIAREHPPFTAIEREIIQAGVGNLHAWLGGALQHSTERRRRFRPVDALFDQLAVDAMHAGQQTTVIVISIGASVLRPGVMQSWLGKIRDQLRSWDFASILSDSEIAVLLYGASADAAAGVSARLTQLIESDDTIGGSIRPAIGMTTCLPDSNLEHSVVDAARANVRLQSSK